MAVRTSRKSVRSSIKPTILFPSEVLALLFGTVIVVFTVLALVLLSRSLTDSSVSLPGAMYRVFTLRLDVILLSTAALAACLEPLLTRLLVGSLRRWQDRYPAATLGAVCLFLAAFIVHFGRWQFGGYDFNIMIETGWREIQGQKPYVDFLTTTPPGFNLGIEYAYRLFGVNWSANLYLCAFFSCTTFLWMYWMMRRLSMGRLAAMAVALTIECAGVLVLSFWWYNDTVLILAAVFFLACLLYRRQPEAVAAQLSYVLALALLALMKPNIAGASIVAGVTLLLLSSKRRGRLLWLTLAGTVLAVFVLLANHVRVGAMLTSYMSVAREHGGLSELFGYRQLDRFSQYSALLWVGFVSLPLLWLAPWLWRRIRERDWKEIFYALFFPMALGVALYGLATNGEYRDVECTILLAAGGVLAFVLRRDSGSLRRMYAAILCASVVGDLCYAAARVRIYSIGPGVYFQWQDNEHRIDSGYLKGMRVSSNLIEVEQEIQHAVATNPGPYYFGQRLDFNYAVLGIASPEHLPAWWEPGTSFASKDSDRVLETWKEKRFQTLFFLKQSDRLLGFDHTYYSDQFLNTITRDYLRDDSMPYIVVYRRRTQTPLNEIGS